MQAIVDAINNLSAKDGWDYAALLLPNVLSFAAIILAILIPVRIANRQDKIALFQLRFETYRSLSWIVKLKGVLTRESIDDETPYEKCKFAKNMILYAVSTEQDSASRHDQFKQYEILTKKFDEILSGSLLFEQGQKKEEIIRKLYDALMKILRQPDNAEFDGMDVIALINQINTEILPAMKQELIVRR